MAVIERTDLRYEIKLACPASFLHQARSWIRLHPEGFCVAYPPRSVHNLYLDTLHLNSLRANLSGISRREKLRLRWYGGNAQSGKDGRTENDLIVRPVLERKYKMNMLGGKERETLSCSLDLQHDWNQILDVVRSAASPHWRPWLDAGTSPTLLSHYRREYYVTPDGDLRATLDYDMAAYDQRFSYRPNRRSKLLLQDVVVIELKAALGQETRLEMSAARFPIPRSRNSKYVNSLMATML